MRKKRSEVFPVGGDGGKGLIRQFNESYLNIMICRGTGGMVFSIRDMRKNQSGAETFGDVLRKIQ